MSDRNPKHRDLTEGPVLKEILKLTIPMIVGLASVIMYGLIDTYFVSRLGLQQLAAISFTFPVTMFFGSVAMGLGIGVSSVVSRALGSKQYDEAKRITSHSLVLSFIVTVILAAAGLLTVRPLFSAMGADGDVLNYIEEYMRIIYWGTIFVIIPMVANNAIRSAGRPIFPAIVMIASAGVNAVLAPIMIFGLFGCPRLEMAGAGYATVIAQIVASAGSLYFLRYKVNLMALSALSADYIRNDIKRVLYVGLPSVLTQIINPLSMGIITWLIAGYGKDAVAGAGVAIRVEMVAVIPMMAVATSITPFVGQNWGAGRIDRIREAVTKALLLCLGWAAFASTALFVWGNYAAAEFNDSPTVIETAHLFFKIVTSTAFFQASVYVMVALFNGMGNPKPGAIALFCRMLVITVPLAFVFGHFFGLPGIFSALGLANIAVATVFFFWMRRELFTSYLGTDLPLM